ncbi:MAG: NAD-dependent epimerase/dehydratase family protein, partial [Roseburia sp.]|nr:NAD-dependent epimerase/dehydratase family protein [Roseburia sp.]
MVTGSNGFIGSHVSRYLRKQGNYVIGLGRRDKPVGQVDEYVCCDMDTEKVEQLFEIIRVKRIDAVVHLAADMRKESYGVEVVSHNCVGTQRLLELCEKKGIGVF